MTAPIPTTKSTTVEVECDADHCDDYLGGCPYENEFDLESFRQRVQLIFRHHGPEAEQFCDWTKCAVEPWRSLAAVVEVMS